MNAKFQDDFRRMTGTEYRGALKDHIQIVLMHHLRYMRYFRKYEQKKSIFTRFLMYRITRKYGLEISVHAKIGSGLYLGHPYNITVAEDAILGDNVNLNKGCTIGRENRGKRSGVPTIGNRVYIGINSTVVGKISIGDDVLIAPNTFVNQDIPAHSVVIGNPAVIHPKEHATDGYINFCN